jgi:endonuclease III
MMDKIGKFMEKHGMMIVILLVVLSTCTGSMSKKRYEKKVMSEFDSLKTEIKVLKQELQKEIKVEGLKVEKRMIQSTDRKILDVNRQGEIDKEIQQLEKQ